MFLKHNNPIIGSRNLFMLDRRMGLNGPLNGRQNLKKKTVQIFLDSPSIGEVPGAPRALKTIKKLFLLKKIAFVNPMMG